MRISDWSSDVCSSDLLFEVEDGSGCFRQSGGEEREGAPVDAVKPLHFLDAVPPHPLPPRCIKVLREPALGMVARKVGRYSAIDAVHQEERRDRKSTRLNSSH